MGKDNTTIVNHIDLKLLEMLKKGLGKQPDCFLVGLVYINEQY